LFTTRLSWLDAVSDEAIERPVLDTAASVPTPRSLFTESYISLALRNPPPPTCGPGTLISTRPFTACSRSVLPATAVGLSSPEACSQSAKVLVTAKPSGRQRRECAFRKSACASQLSPEHAALSHTEC